MCNREGDAPIGWREAAKKWLVFAITYGRMRLTLARFDEPFFHGKIAGRPRDAPQHRYGTRSRHGLHLRPLPRRVHTGLEGALLHDALLRSAIEERSRGKTRARASAHRAGAGCNACERSIFAAFHSCPHGAEAGIRFRNQRRAFARAAEGRLHPGDLSRG